LLSSLLQYTSAMFGTLSNTHTVTMGLFFLNMVLEAVAAYLVFVEHKRQSDRSRLFIAFFFLTSSIASLGEIVIALCAPEYAGGFLLMDPMIILFGFLIFFLLWLYPIEMLRPGWIDWRRGLLLLSPWLVFMAALLMLHHLDIRPLYTINDIVTYIREPNVWLRIVLTFIFIPYGIWLLLMQHNWRNSNAPLEWVRAVVVITLCMTITYFASRGLRLFWANIAHEALYIGLTLLILYIELVVRLNVLRPTPTEESDYLPPVVTLELPEETQPSEEPEQKSDVITEVSQRIQMALDNPDIWQNPDLTQDDLIRMVRTNRRYLQLGIKQLGYDSYPDMINRRRVAYIQEQLHSNPAQNLQNLFYDAGYRSRTSAWRNFTAIAGCSPMEYCESTRVEQ